MKITKRVIDASAPESKTRYLWDSELGGFGVKILPSGRKTFIVQYRMGGRGKRTRRVTIGVHGSISADQARSAAKKTLALVAIGTDPLAERDEERAALKVSDVIELFTKEHVEAKLSDNTISAYEAIARLHLSDDFKKMNIRDVTRQDVARLHFSLRKSHTMANKTLAYLSKLFNWSEKFGYRDDHTNPCRHIDKFKEERRERFLSPEEQERLWKVLDRAEEENLTTLYHVGALRVIILSGARLREILHMKWEYADLQRGVIRLPKSKTGAKNIYLNQTAIDVIKSMPKQRGNPYVFCGLVPGQPIHEMQKAWQRIRKLADIEDVRIHDLRHTFASVAVMNGMSLPVVGALLGHSQPRTTARYAHLAVDPLLEAAELVGEKLLERKHSVR